MAHMKPLQFAELEVLREISEGRQVWAKSDPIIKILDDRGMIQSGRYQGQPDWRWRLAELGSAYLSGCEHAASDSRVTATMSESSACKSPASVV